MTDRLQDEAVEAMAEGLAAVFPLWERSYRQRVAGRALAALPAGIWRSDGQGEVEPLTRDALAEAFATVTGTWDDIEELREVMPDVLAALSATDTESSS